MIPQTGISDIVLVEPTYNATQILAINQEWMANSYRLGIFCLCVGFIIGSVSVYLHYYLKKDKSDGSS